MTMNSPFILEGIVTTIDPNGDLNIAPMGPEFPEEPRSEVTEFVLRPFRSSTTYHNLCSHPEGVFHVTDDAGLIARAVLGQIPSNLIVVDASGVRGRVIRDACHWYAFQAIEIRHDEPRSWVQCRVVASHIQRPFVGFNRAKHAIVELAIMVTRLHILDREIVLAELERTSRIVNKTGGLAERESLELLRQHIGRVYQMPSTL